MQYRLRYMHIYNAFYGKFIDSIKIILKYYIFTIIKFCMHFDNNKRFFNI